MVILQVFQQTVVLKVSKYFIFLQNILHEKVEEKSNKTQQISQISRCSGEHYNILNSYWVYIENLPKVVFKNKCVKGIVVFSIHSYLKVTQV